MYSVLNKATRQYDYYESGEPEPWHAPAPPKARAVSSLGSTPDDAAWALPLGAKRVGSGSDARGRIAVIGRPGAGAAAVLGDVEPAVVAAGAIALMIAGVAFMAKAGR